jgi:hypothetical protein
MNGIFITTDEYSEVTFTNPRDLFKNDITFIGAWVERNLVYIGLKDTRDQPLNKRIPNHWIAGAVFDEPPRGPVLIVQTNEHGDPI